MPPEVIENVEVKPLTPAETFAKYRADKAAAATPEGIAAKAASDAAAAAPPVPEKRASGDERKFRRMLSKRDQELGALRAQVEALTPKPAAAATVVAATSDAAPRREDFAAGPSGDDEFTDAKIAHGVKKATDKANAETAQARVIRETLDGYNDRMAKAPEKYADWDAVLAAGSGAALSVDLGAECPSLFWAIAKSPYNDDCFYEWLKDSTKLQALITQYKSGPQGEIDALTAFHRFEGRVGRDAKSSDAKDAVKAAPPKADDAVAVKPPKPRPSAEAQVRGGAPAPDGKPAVTLPGTNTVNPAWKIWNRQRQGR